jgi:hypothetical protein
MNPSEAERWISYAESDLKAARALLESPEFFPRQICFFAQQCAEKPSKPFWFLMRSLPSCKNASDRINKEIISKTKESPS